ncbi:MAG TPA: dihydrofolate reductase [Thermoanaerobaculia bacterium]|nr:dihydrofolate reductase [Thermoanaerobaculia bacterium]
MPVSLIAAVAANGVIGRDGGLPWRLPEDLRRFRCLTLGHFLIVGRRTWESVGRPLPGREFVVVTRRGGLADRSLRVARSVSEAIELARRAGDDEPFVAGGAGIYREALEQALVDRIYLTRIEADYEGDTSFPPFDESAWELIDREDHAAEPEKELPAFAFLTYERRPPGATGS